MKLSAYQSDDKQKKKNSSKISKEEEEIQVLAGDEQLQRVFVAGQSDEVKSFIDNIKGQNWCEDINIDQDDNELAQVNLKYFEGHHF
ncbi:hypothetical protein ABPG72_011176 [Tetrahymena utriculariae]